MESLVAHEHYSNFYSHPKLLNLWPPAPQKSIPQSGVCESDLKLTEITFFPNEQLVLQEPKHTTLTISPNEMTH